MHIRQTQVLLALLTTVFCTVAFSSVGTDQRGVLAWVDLASGGEPVIQQPLLLAKADKFTVCVLLPNGKVETKELTKDQIDKIKVDHPQAVEDGACEDKFSGG